MPEAQLLEQERTVTKQVGRLFCIRERRDRVSLVVIVVKLWNNLIKRWTYGVSNDKNRVLELLRAEWGKSFNGTDGPSKRAITGKAPSESIPEYTSFCTYPRSQTVPT